MRPLPLIVACVALAAAAGGVAALVVAPSRPAQADAAAPNASQELAAALKRVEARQGELDKSLAELRDAVAANSSARKEVVDVDAAIARWMQAHPNDAGAHASGDEVAASAVPQKSKAQRVAEAFARMQDKSLSDVERQRLWRELAKEGLSDDLIAEYERRAEEDPNDPARKVELGHAYLLKIFEVGSSPEAGVWATKADKAFDSALALDDHNWDARFSKAVSLSFWPPLFGKQKEAIANFETLIAQQSDLPKNDRFAQTHLMLGNMYQQLGQTDKAVSAWQNGLAQFPGNADLQKQLELYGAH